MTISKCFEKKIILGVRQKVLLLLMIILLTALTISGWFALQEEKENALKDLNQRGEDISRFVAKSLSFSVVGYDYHTVSLLIEEITSSVDIGYAKVVNKKGNTMAEEGQLIDNNLIMFEEPILFQEEVIGNLTLGLNTDTKIGQLENQKYSLIKREAFIILLIALGEFIALSLIIIRPVSIISKSLDEQVHKDGQIVGNIPIISNDEFGDLACRFNKLSESLNMANTELQSRIDFADAKLVENNQLLRQQSEELQIMNEEFKKLSLTDSLTGLYNRRFFDETLRSELSLSYRHGDVNSLLMIDIDHFKKVNDTYGHDVGDLVIKAVADLLTHRLRKTDLICRIGGEEYVSLCKRTDKNDILKLAEKVRKEIENNSIIVNDIQVSVTVSIGVVTIPTSEKHLELGDVIKHVDLALYHSKNSGRNRVTHYDQISG